MKLLSDKSSNRWLALAAPLWRFTSLVGGGSVRRAAAHTMRNFSTSILLFATCCGLAQSSGDPGSPSQAPEVWIQALCEGKTIHDGDTLHAPANIFMFLGVTSAVTGHPGDVITIDLMVDTNKLCSKKCAWHKEVAPDPHSRNAQPMIMRQAGFDTADFDWTNPPAGSHVLTAHVFSLHGLSAVSDPLHITIVSSAAPPAGAHSSIVF